MSSDGFWTNAPIWRSVWHWLPSNPWRHSKPVGDDCLWHRPRRPVCFIWSSLWILQLLSYPLRSSTLCGSPSQSAISFDNVCPISQLTSDWSSPWKHTIIFSLSFPSWTGSFRGYPCEEESIRFINYLSHHQSAATQKIRECRWGIWTHNSCMRTFLRN